jgi:hypothetical protein
LHCGAPLKGRLNWLWLFLGCEVYKDIFQAHGDSS